MQRALARHAGAFRAIMQKHIVGFIELREAFCATTPGAEDAVQDAYVSAFENLASYCGEAMLADVAVPHYLIEVS